MSELEHATVDSMLDWMSNSNAGQLPRLIEVEVFLDDEHCEALDHQVEMVKDLQLEEESEKRRIAEAVSRRPAILAQSHWSKSTFAKSDIGYHDRYKVICYAEKLTPAQIADEEYRLRFERGWSSAQGPAKAAHSQAYGLMLVPKGTADYELAEMSTSVVYQETTDSGD